LPLSASRHRWFTGRKCPINFVNIVSTWVFWYFLMTVHIFFVLSSGHWLKPVCVSSPCIRCNNYLYVTLNRIEKSIILCTSWLFSLNRVALPQRHVSYISIFPNSTVYDSSSKIVCKCVYYGTSFVASNNIMAHFAARFMAYFVIM